MEPFLLSRSRACVLGLSVLASACGGGDRRPPPGTDAGRVADASSLPDAATEVDAAPGVDASPPADATIPPRPDGGGNCEDGIQNGGETDVDCGRVCPSPSQCSIGEGCEHGVDCRSGVCADGACAAPTCDDGVMNGLERDVDCGGGTCPGCDTGERCLVADDCASRVCASDARCAAPTCDDGVVNGGEVGLDCAGPCPLCEWGQACTTGADCVTGVCEADGLGLRCVEYPVITSLSPSAGHGNDEIVITGTGFHSLEPRVRFGTTTVMGDRDSYTQVTVRAPDLPVGTVDVAVANTDGRESNELPFRYLAPATFGTPSAVTVDATWTTIDRLRTGDVDGDGDVDVLVADGRLPTGGLSLPYVRVLRNGAGVLAVASTVTFPADVVDFRVVRLDAGSSLDLVASLANGAVAVALGNGDGTFGAPVQTPLAASAGEIWAGNVDLDTYADVVVAYQDPSVYRVGILSGMGDGTFAPVQAVSIPGPGRGLTAFQLHGDATLEIFVGQSSEIRRIKYLVGSDWVSHTTDRYIFGDGRTLDAVDFGGDGDVDLVEAHGILQADSGALVGLEVAYAGPGDYATDVAPADFDGDGHVDVAWTRSSGFFEVRLGAPGPTFGLIRRTITTPETTYAVEAADFDGDGLLDLVVGGQRSVFVVRNTTP